MPSKSVIIAVDFDGTLVEHRFPEIGRPVPEAFEWLKKFQSAGAKLILWTMRDDGRLLRGIEPIPEDITPHSGNTYLTDAVQFCRDAGIEFWGVNCNPEQHTWSGSPKCYAHIYIDDAAHGCPVVMDSEGKRWRADWSIIGPQVWELIFIEGSDQGD